MATGFGRMEVINNPEQFQWKRDKAEASLSKECEIRKWISEKGLLTSFAM